MIYCRDCDAPLPGAHYNQMYCSECAKIRKNGRKFRPPRREHKYKGPSIDEIAKLAREAGMSYGEYVSKVGV